MNRPIDQLKAMLAARAEQGDAPATIAQMREAMLQFTSMLQMPEGVTVAETELGGVRGLRHTPDMAAPEAVLLYFHGGGYVQGSPQTHRSLVGHLARLSGVEAASMDYRLAPEAPFPAAVEDALASYQALLDSGIAPGRIIVGGDSAGGGLALASMVRARDTGLPGPAGLVLLSPWSDLAHGGWSHRSLGARDPMVRTENLERLAGLYLDGARADDALASPLMADLEGLAPMLIQVGSDEVLLSDATQLAERAGAARVEVILEVWPEMIHVFQIFQDMLDEARAANARIGQWMREKLGL